MGESDPLATLGDPWGRLIEMAPHSKATRDGTQAGSMSAASTESAAAA